MARRRDLEIGPKGCLIAAADMSTGAAFDAWLENVGPYVDIVKIGMQLQTAGEVGSPEAIRRIRKKLPAARVMFDGKFHEIPTNMVAAVKNILEIGGIWGFTVHASATARAMQEIAKIKGDTLMLGVTVLTTMTEAECERIYRTPVEETVLRLADEALTGGADGLVCSPKELMMLGEHEQFDRLKRVTPNIRPTWAVVPGDDQNKNREMTPADAIKAGADHLVVGRPVSGRFDTANGPAETVPKLLAEIQEAFDALRRVA